MISTHPINPAGLIGRKIETSLFIIDGQQCPSRAQFDQGRASGQDFEVNSVAFCGYAASDVRLIDRSDKELGCALQLISVPILPLSYFLKMALWAMFNLFPGVAIM